MPTWAINNEKLFLEQLGMTQSHATLKLRRILLLELARLRGQERCFRCGKMLDLSDITIEHKIPWRHSDRASELYFSLSNIAFSHHSCNSKAARPVRRTVGKSGFRGVSAKKGRFQAKFDGKSLGVYATREEAAKAYDLAAIKRFGSDAILNFPDFDYTKYVPIKADPFRFKQYSIDYRKDNEKWRVKIYFKKRVLFSGQFDSYDEAEKVAKEKREELINE